MRLPPDLAPLFDERFVRSSELVEEYVHRLAVGIFLGLRLTDAAAVAGTTAEIASRAGLDPSRSEVALRWVLRTLAARGALESIRGEDGRERFRAAAPPAAADPSEVEAEQERHDPAALPAFRFAALAAEHYPAFLAGRVSGEEILFAPESGSAWSDYFSNDNPLYAINNAVGAVAADRALPPRGGRILELGGGLGSGAAALLGRFESRGRLGSIAGYRFSELSIPLLRRGRKALGARWPGVPFGFVRLDMDKPFAEAGVEPGGADLVYGVNTLHVAHDLAFTLGEVRRALAPGGALVVSECVRPFDGQPLYVELIFNLLEAFRAPRLVAGWRPNGGFLTPEQWADALRANGFANVSLAPDVTRLRDDHPSFMVSAITATRA